MKLIKILTFPPIHVHHLTRDYWDARSSTTRISFQFAGLAALTVTGGKEEKMSNIYIQEPPTNGKVIMYTTVGDIEIELWSKETPLACRNFVQLCLEGYYNQTIFHRLAPNFVVQGGDPSGTGFGGESIYGEPFRNEPHSRLRFMRRGLLATANNGDNHSNGSQFFFTLDATPDLQNKHTIFGKAVGTTLFNMLKLGESEIDANERPVYLNKILKTEVVINPFDDIVPRSFASEKPAEAPVDSKAKATKNFGLLSFGEVAEEEEEETEATISEFRTVSKSLHDVVDDPKMSSQSVLSEPIEESTFDELQSVQQRLRKAEAERLDELEAADAQREATKNATSNSRVDTLRQQALQLQKELTRTKVKDIPLEARTVKAVDAAVVDYKKGMEIYESRRRKAKNKEGDKRDDREATTLAKLKAFQSTLHAVRIDGEESPAVQSQLAADSGRLEEAEEDITGLNWMKGRLSFEAENYKLAKDASTKADDWYELYDPRNPLNKRKREAAKDGGKPKSRRNDEKA